MTSFSRGDIVLVKFVFADEHDMIGGKMGELPASELHTVEDKLREILAL